MAHITVCGSAPTADIDLLRAQARKEGIDISVESAGDEASLDAAYGYVSYLPCDRTQILALFASRPLGVGYRIPFFQCSDDSPETETLDDLPVFGYFRSPLSQQMAYTIVHSIARQNESNRQAQEMLAEVMKYRKQKQQLITIGTALSSQNNLDTLLELILGESRDMVGADAGSVYVRERDKPGGILVDTLRFKIAQNDSAAVQERLKEFTIPIDTNSIAGYVAATGTPLCIEDVYQLDETVPYRFGKEYDRKIGYRIKSMLTVPLKNIDGETVGVLQLINKKREQNPRLAPETVTANVVGFTLADQGFVASIAALAAVSIERMQLYESIQHLFEGFLSSSIAAIDARDRVTSGHSRRVMGYAMAFADAINATDSGPFAGVSFSPQEKRQFKFAALLHDIGKIGVPEAILTKERKLDAGDMDALMSRLDYARLLLEKVEETSVPWRCAEELENDRAFLHKVDTSGAISEQDAARVAQIGGKYYHDCVRRKVEILPEPQRGALSVRRGNLTPEERRIINSHAHATRTILSKIPWIKQLERIPEIACHHHEKLDGSGYPDGLRDNEISLESRILAVIDIYEALAAQDRPYKPRVPAAKAIAILRAEADRGHLDSEVVEFFVEKEIYSLFLEPEAKDE